MGILEETKAKLEVKLKEHAEKYLDDAEVKTCEVKATDAIPSVDTTHQVHVQRTYKEGKIVTREEAEDELITIKSYPRWVPMAEVAFGCSMTINIGNFESIKLDVRVSLPTPVEELDDAFLAAKNFVDLKLNREVSDIKAYREAKDKA